MNTLAKKIIIHSILPLIIGFTIYFIAKPDNWLTKRIFPFEFSNRQCNYAADWLTRIIIFNGPDFCWSYSLTSSLLFWKQLSRFKTIFFYVFIFLIILMQELVQYCLPSYFTFDILDIVAALLAFLLSFYLNRKYV